MVGDRHEFTSRAYTGNGSPLRNGSDLGTGSSSHYLSGKRHPRFYVLLVFEAPLGGTDPPEYDHQ